MMMMMMVMMMDLLLEMVVLMSHFENDHDGADHEGCGQRMVMAVVCSMCMVR